MSACACRNSHLRRWLLSALLLLAALQPSRADCPKSCVCHVPAEVHCTFRYLTAVPDHIPPAVERINLGYNSITALRESDLSGFEKLELLMLHSNTIHRIEDRAFQNLKLLQVLKLSHNRLKEINKETFKGLDSLLRLHIDHNHIEFINPEAFYGLTNLQMINLEGNRLQQLHKDTFITLRHSQVFRLSSVRTIYLSDNFLTALPADIFSGCSQLENVFLHGNPWLCDCHMEWFSMWAQRNTGVLKCKRDRGNPRGQLCPVCANPFSYQNRTLALLHSDAFTCSKPWIEPHLKQKNISLEEGDFTPVSPKDFIAPLGSMQMNLTDEFYNDASLLCTVQRPTAFENLTLTSEEEEGHSVSVLTTGIITYLVCNIDYEHIQRLWKILASHSDSPMWLERGLMLARTPEMVFRYSQVNDNKEGSVTNVEADIKASPAWLMQGKISLQLDRTTTTFSTLHIKYQSEVNLRVESTTSKRGHYSWTMIKRDNQIKTEYTVITGGVAQLSCQIQGEPKPLMEWILPEGSKVRAPYSSEDGRIIITAEGKLTLRRAVSSDAGLYWCIATNYLDADILIFRVTVLSPDVEEVEVNGLQLSKSLGENLILDCSSTGSPVASVTWILPDHSVMDKSQGNRNVFENGTLFIKGLTARDRGFYRCLVANHLGVDLLVSQVTLNEKTLQAETSLDSEGSGMVIDVKINSNFGEKTLNIDENLSTNPADRTTQEFRTVTSDRPFPRSRLGGRGSSGVRFSQRRRGAARNRQIWNNRTFDKASRTVDPEKFAELVKKARHGSRLENGKENKQVIYENSYNESHSSDNEIGSGDFHNEEHPVVVQRMVEPTKETFTEQSSHIQSNRIKENQSSPTAEAYMQSDSTSVKSIFSGMPNPIDTTEFYVIEKTSNAPLNIQPVTLQLTVTDTEQESPLKLSVEPAAETGVVFPLTTDPNVSPVRHEPGPIDLFHHTDPESQTTFTAITTAERQEDEITFHTTQTIKSPHLSTGSTIISRQKIHLIPNSRGTGGRRIFKGRRRIIKPNRITDIRSFISRLKQPSLTKGGNTTVPFQTELTTDSDSDKKKKTMANTKLQVVTPTAFSSFLIKTETPASTLKSTASYTDRHNTASDPLGNTESTSELSVEYITSADGPEIDPTVDTLFTLSKKPSLTSTTTTASKVIRGRIPWKRLFQGKEREKILNRLKRPSSLAKISTSPVAAKTSTTAMPTTKPISIPEAETRSTPPSVQRRSKEDSSHDDYGGLAYAEFEFTTAEPNFQYIITTSSSHYPKSLTTDETPTVLQTLVPPPTVKPHSVENLDDGFSGSGKIPDDFLVIRQKPVKTRGRQGQRIHPFKGRRPFRKPGSTKTIPTTTTRVSTTEETSMATTMRATTQFQDSSLHTSSSAISIDQTSGEKDLEDKTLSSLMTYSTTKTPIIVSTSYYPTTSSISVTTKQPYTMAQKGMYSNIRPPIQRKNDYTTRRPLLKRIRPTAQSSVVRGSADTGFEFHTMTIFTDKQRHNKHDSYNKGMHNPPVFDKVPDNKWTTASTPGFELTAKAMTNKPRIVGGNAASFTVLSNSDAFLPCEAIGNPQPLITWKRFSSSTGNTMTIIGRMGKFEVMSNGTLSIQNANVKDRGQYICLAENDHGSDKLLITLSVVAYPSRILEPKMRDMKSHTGKTVAMKCKAEGRPMPVISWILANRTQVRGQTKEKERVSVSSEGTLIIENVSVYDRGYYKCIASNPAGADTITVRLQVVAAPPGIVEEKRQLLKASLRQNLWLPCTGHGNPHPAIHWALHDGEILKFNRQASDKRMSVYENGTLLIKHVASTDSGKYECIATSSTGSERRVVTLTVETQEYAPRIVETSGSMTELSYGDQLRLNCSATGDPKPRIIWRLPSKAVVDQWHRMGSRIQVLDNGTLIVNTVSDKDAGDYICVARSMIDDDLQLMRVSVSMKPAKIEPKLYERTKVPYGNDLKVDCKASGLPKPEISWGLPDGTVVNSAWQADASHGGGRARRYTLFENGTLYLNQVGISEEGDYTCYAENQVGKDEMHVHITVVTSPPRIQPTSKTYARVKPGNNIRFDCEVFGEPKPKILWMLPSNDVIAASNERYLMHVNGSLDIRDVKLDDAGEYVCMARNPGGEKRKKYKLDIDGNPPLINGYRQNRTVIKDVAPKHSRKLIDCNAVGHPTPVITWIMPDNIFLQAPYFGSRITVHHNGTLEIRNVRPTDTAEFICLARNDGGEAVLVVQLEVTSMLRRPIFKNPFNERIVSGTGKTTVLNCSASGNPFPEIIWILPNGTRFISGSSNGSRHQFGSDGTLVIYNSQKEDSGKYRCGAKNYLGYIEKVIILNIGQKPYILTRPKSTIRSLAGEVLSLHCLSDGSPRPGIIWTVPSGQSLTQLEVLGRYRLLQNGTLVIQDTMLIDQGNYICRARNDVGEAVLTVPVSITAYPPRISSGPPQSVRVISGTPIQLKCAASGIPKPEITWELPSHSVHSAAEQRLLHPQGTLIIQRPTSSDSGAYKCLAKNNVGTDSKVTYVRVL
ncbi:unnamed protein product [Menidia menidia]|uniref:(Atlantic silverside) hypothetical protein n=1 Tax=Menidia menidia TaxID=238744 RepID=A0A8S4BR13_9TELE|nr:unnamed protein product [Menidia menidia]